MAATDKGALSDGRGKKKKKCLCADINGDEVYSSCVYVAQQQWPCDVSHKRSDGGGRCDNATSIIIQHQLERRVGGIDLSHHHLLVSGCRLVDGQTPPIRVPCPPTVRHLLPPFFVFLFFFYLPYVLPLTQPRPSSPSFRPSSPFSPCEPTYFQRLPDWSRGRPKLSSLGCRSSRVSSARRSIPLPGCFVLFRSAFNCFPLIPFKQKLCRNFREKKEKENWNLR